MQRNRRFLASFLAVVMLFSMLPTMSFAVTSNVYINNVEITSDKGTISVVVTPGVGHTGSGKYLFCMIYNVAEEDDTGEVPTIDESLSIPNMPLYPVISFKTDEPVPKVTELKPYKLTQQQTQALPYGENLRKYYVEESWWSKWEDYSGLSDEEIAAKLTEEVGEGSVVPPPSDKWRAIVWSGVGGYAEEYVTIEFELDADGSVVEPAKSCTVKFNVNGGSGPAPTSAPYKSTDTTGVADPNYNGTKAGYQLRGWTTTADNAETKVTFPYVPTDFEDGDEITLYAYWAENATVTYDPNGATGTITDDTTYAIGDQVTLKDYTGFIAPADKPLFAGWKFGETIYQPGDKVTLTGTTNTFVAQWSEKPSAEVKGTNIEVTYSGTAVTLADAIKEKLTVVTVDGVEMTSDDISKLKLTYSGGAIPTDAGTYTLTITYDDGEKTGSDDITLKINPKKMDPPTITLKSRGTDSFKAEITSGAICTSLKGDAAPDKEDKSDWGESAGEVIFSNRTPNTEYTIYAYTPAPDDSGNYEDSDIANLKVKTAKEAHLSSMFEIPSQPYNGDEWTKEEIAALIVPAEGYDGEVGEEIEVTSVVSKKNSNITTAKNVDTYTVTFKVSEGNQYAAENSGITLDWEITPAEQILTLDATELSSNAMTLYKGQSVEVTVTSNASDETDWNWAEVYTTSGSADYVTASPANLTDNKFTVTAKEVTENAVTITVTSPATANYAEATATFTVTVVSQFDNTLTAESDKDSVQYGDTFTVTAEYGNNTEGKVTFPESVDGAVLEKVEGLSATYRATDSKDTAVITVTQEPSVSVKEGRVEVTVALKPRVVTIAGPLAGVEKVYDGTDTAAIDGKPTITNIVGDETDGYDDVYLSDDLSGKFASSDAKTTAQAVELVTDDMKLLGDDNEHYTLEGATWPDVAGAIISPRPINVSLKDHVEKTYGEILELKDTDLTIEATNGDRGLAPDKDKSDLGITTTAIESTGEPADAALGSHSFSVTGSTNYEITILTDKMVIVSPADMEPKLTVPGDITYGDTGKKAEVSNTDGVINPVTVEYKIVAAEIEVTKDNWDSVSENKDYATINATSGLITTIKAVETGKVKVVAKVSATGYHNVYLTGALVIAKITPEINASDVTDGAYVGIAYDLDNIGAKIMDGDDDITAYYNISYSGNGVADGKLTATTTNPVEVTITATPKDAYKDNYNAPANKTVNITAKTPDDNELTAKSVESVQYGDTFIVTAEPKNNTKGAITFPDSVEGAERVSVDGLSATYRATNSTGNAVITVEQEAYGSVDKGSAPVTVALKPRVVTIAGELAGDKKVYDGTPAATISGTPTITNIVGAGTPNADVVYLTGTLSGTFASSDAKTTAQAVELVTDDMGLGGANSGHYTLEGATWPDVEGAIISPRPVNVSLTNDITKTYGETLELKVSHLTAEATGENRGLAPNKDISDLGITTITSDGTAATAAVGKHPLASVVGNGNYTITIAGNYNVVVEPATMTPALTIPVITYGDTDKSASVKDAPDGATVEYKIVQTGTIIDQNSWASVTENDTYATINATNGQITTIKAVESGTAMVAAKVSAEGYNDAYITGELAIGKKVVEAVLSNAGLTTSVDIAVDLEEAGLTVTGGISGNLVKDTDYTLAYGIASSGTTGITSVTGSTTNAPTTPGINTDAAKAEITVTLISDAADNYTFMAENTPVNATKKEVTINVSDALFTVKFNANGGAGDAMSDMTVAVREERVLPKSTFTKDGYAFMGWAYSTDAQQAVHSDGATVVFTVDNEGNTLGKDSVVTLYAVWAQTYALTVNAGDGGENATGAGSFIAGATAEISVANKAGFEFKEWTVTKGSLVLDDTTKASQTATITMPAEAVELTATFISLLTIDPKEAIEKTASTAGNKLKVADFIDGATPLFAGDTANTLFTATPAGDAGVFTGNGVTITFYTDDTYATVSSNMTALPATAGTYYYTVEVKAEADNTPKDNYRLQTLSAAKGVLTITRSNSGGGGGSTSYTLTFETNGGSPVDSVKKTAGVKIALTQTTTREGYEFTGWYADEALTNPVSEVILKKNTTVYAGWKEEEATSTGVDDWLNAKEHMAYMQGYPEGTFMPDGNLTRAEAAQLFYNLLLDKSAAADMNFDDVAADAWYAPAVNKLASIGVIMGTGEDRFEPQRQITRAEFTAIAMRFTDSDRSGENAFSDVTANDWFYDVVVGSVKFGWIRGYENNTFRPNNAITRAETASIVNRMLERSADEAYAQAHKEELKQFSDISPEHWSYLDVVEATNEHDYVKDTNKETWQ